MKKLILICLLLSVSMVEAATRYVSLSGSQTPPYTNWATAFTNLIEACSSASIVAGDVLSVTNGTYVLTNTVTISKTNVTVSSVNGKLNTIIDGNGAVKCLSVSGTNVVVDGFTIQNGYGSNIPYAGVSVSAGSQLINSTIRNNAISNCAPGGVVAISVATAGIVSNCLITGNTTIGGTGVTGVNCANAGTLVVNCVISNNTGYIAGAYASLGATVDRCIMVNNYTTTRSAGVTLGAGGIARNCLIAHNSGGGASSRFAELQQSGTNTSLLQNCTIVSNTAGYGIYVDYGGTVENCISSHNAASLFIGPNIGPTVLNNNCIDYVNASAYGTGNIQTNNPGYVDVNNDDFRLAFDSPCINRGLNQSWIPGTYDLLGNPRISSYAVDMGAYEYQFPPAIMHLLRGGSVNLKTTP